MPWFAGAVEMDNLRSPADAYRKVDFDARMAGTDPSQLALLCYEQLAAALDRAIKFEAPALQRLQQDVAEIAGALRSAPGRQG